MKRTELNTRQGAAKVRAQTSYIEDPEFPCMAQQEPSAVGHTGRPDDWFARFLRVLLAKTNPEPAG